MRASDAVDAVAPRSSTSLGGIWSRRNRKRLDVRSGVG